ncbi:MAG TPA: ATP-binding cassette domain-containing protein [Candidatus Bathyarchaeia archaeon]|nr:ATP-binding cassette domain-containing protein [Candidatus Bathyarchaeia archaeon]
MDPVDVRALSKSFSTKEGPILRKKRKSLVAVDEISFSVPRGKIFGLLGPNGAGKTTIIKMLCTLITPTTGDAFINGYSIVKEPQKVRESLGVMLTGERTLYWKLTGRENLEYFAALYHLQHSDIRKRIDYLLQLLGLSDRENTVVENYSTGMRIRLSFAKALLNEAPVLLFDEPTASLDPQSSRLIRDIIRDLKKDGYAVILTTHNMDEADALSDRVAIIDHGRIVRYGSPSELKEKLKSNDVIEIEAHNLTDQTANALQSFSEISKVAISTIDSNDNTGLLRIHAEKGKEVLPKLLEFLVRKQVSITKVSFIEPTLEDVFIEETGRSLRD